MRERQAPGEPGSGRQIDAVTGAWLPETTAARTAGTVEAGTAEAGTVEAGTVEAGTVEARIAGAGTAGMGGGPEFLINLGASHPSAHGMLRLRLTLDGERISAAEPEIGFMHRGAEKLFEARDYRQIIVLANRHDWLGAFASELGVVLAAERLAGIEVPPRAVWARTMLAELNRALSHLAFLSSYPPEIAAAAAGPPATAGPPAADPENEPAAPGTAGEPAAARAAFEAREAIQAIMEEISGGRMHYMFNRVGGLKEEIPAGWLARACRVIDEVRAALPAIGATLAQDGFRGRTRGIGVLTPAQVRQYGMSGPAARACGVDFDLRRDEPYLAYAELAGALRVPVRTEGDCLARFECLLDQLAVSLDLAQDCAGRLASLPQGPLSARLPKVFKVPEGHAYAWTEGPLGLSGYYLVSRGGKTPWRLKLRSASFSNMAVLPDLLPGHRAGDLAAVLGSLFFVVGDMDR
jgi:NADH-quinone oxidoreductase subunit D